MFWKNSNCDSKFGHKYKIWWKIGKTDLARRRIPKEWSLSLSLLQRFFNVAIHSLFLFGESFRERERERESSVYSILCTNELHRLGKGGRVWALRIRTRPSSLVRLFANELDFKHVQFICYCWACRHFSSSFSLFFFFFFFESPLILQIFFFFYQRGTLFFFGQNKII